MERLEICFSAAAAAGESWNLTDCEERGERLHAFSSSLPEGLKQGFAYQYRYAQQRMSDVRLLPGPTGETNELYLAGRGVALLILESPGVSPVAAGALLAAALTAGNSVIVCSDNNELNQSVQSAIESSGLPASLVQFCPAASGKKLTEMDIRAAALVGSKQAEQEVNQQLANRTGAIVALVSETDSERLAVSQDPNLVLRFVTERTRTINITAVGGNASLLELGNDGH